MHLRFRGESVLLFGESTPKSGKYRVSIDGKAATEYDPGWLGRYLVGNVHLVQPLAQGLRASEEHTLDLEPVLEPGQELRLESLCIGGQRASATAAK